MPKEAKSDFNPKVDCGISQPKPQSSLTHSPLAALESESHWGTFPESLLCDQLSRVLGPKGCVTWGQRSPEPPELPAGRQNKEKNCGGSVVREAPSHMRLSQSS